MHRVWTRGSYEAGTRSSTLPGGRQIRSFRAKDARVSILLGEDAFDSWRRRGRGIPENTPEEFGRGRRLPGRKTRMSPGLLRAPEVSRRGAVVNSGKGGVEGYDHFCSIPLGLLLTAALVLAGNGRRPQEQQALPGSIPRDLLETTSRVCGSLGYSDSRVALCACCDPLRRLVSLACVFSATSRFYCLPLSVNMIALLIKIG